MKKLLFLVSTTCVLALVSCTKVIDINLNKNDPKLVIEAVVNADSLTHYVTLTNSINFDEDVAPPLVTDATITIKEVNTNTVANYTYNSLLGKYVVTNFSVKEGNTYELTVVSNGKTYVSSSTVPGRVQLDSMKLVKYPFGPNLSYTLVPLRMDPENAINYYKFLLSKNGKRIPGIYVEDDLGFNGQLTKKPIFPYKNELSPDTLVGTQHKWKNKVNGKIELLDSIQVDLEMQCLEEKVYRYFFTLSLNAGNQQSATPSNPDALFTNGALGYFSAQTTQKRSIYMTNK
jgi:hypothetical protein